MIKSIDRGYSIHIIDCLTARENSNNMKHFYQNIPGHFCPEQKLCYKNQIRQTKENCHFVEIGVWKGRSASFMAVEIINSGKK